MKLAQPITMECKRYVVTSSCQNVLADNEVKSSEKNRTPRKAYNWISK